MRQLLTTIAALTVLGLCLGQGCPPPTLGGIGFLQGDSSDSGFITHEDIENLPTGDATDNRYNGRLYAFVSSLIESCECTPQSQFYDRPCEAFQIEFSDEFYLEIIQDRAMIQFRSLMFDEDTEQLVDTPIEKRKGYATAPGSMLADGSFVISGVGGVWDIYTGDIIGEQLILGEGRFSGDFMYLGGIQHLTSRRQGILNDCQYLTRESWARVPWPEK